MQEFINPKSMLTPGVAGSLMMFLVNGIVYQFPEFQPRYVALFLSFLIGAVVWFSQSTAKSYVLERAVYWILNSLVIFVVGLGATNLAADATTKTARGGASSSPSILMISTSFAQDVGKQGPPPSSGSGQQKATVQPATPIKPDATDAQLERERAEKERLKKLLESIKKENEELKRKQDKDQFFKRW